MATARPQQQTRGELCDCEGPEKLRCGPVQNRAFRILCKQTLYLEPQIGSNARKNLAALLSSGVVEFLDLPPALAGHNDQ